MHGSTLEIVAQSPAPKDLVPRTCPNQGASLLGCTYEHFAISVERQQSDRQLELNFKEIEHEVGHEPRFHLFRVDLDPVTLSYVLNDFFIGRDETKMVLAQ